MLLGNFFTISEKTINGSNVLASVDINPLHHIFEGHFPGQPVVPGVCMMQMFKELLELTVDKKMQLRKADHLKFLAVINPLETPSVIVEFSHDNKENGETIVNGRFFKNEVTFLKFRGAFIPQI